ncbi:MAG: Stp1/IreP family PP2C-type Ser/Thr phosphatase [Candidatus Riflebacteria bacterium]|nr:Stp1/IreP family PP2C-type Ser/Thr phosphatase [Candidatus Riflebacteria bacterium]
MSGTATENRRWLLKVFGRTDVGRQRQNNEDTFLIADLNLKDAKPLAEAVTRRVGQKGSLLVVADGMGGANAGEVASQMAVELMFKSLSERWSDRVELQQDDVLPLLHDAVKFANREIKHKGMEDDAKRGMGSTCVAATIVEGKAFLCNVGDSRGYLLRKGEATQLTHDQSFVQHLLDAGAITPEQAAKSPRRNVVTEALGAREEVNVGSVQPLELQHGDILLLCSDGLTGHAEPEDLVRVIYSTDDLVERCKRLIDLANGRGGKDNITVILAEAVIEGEPPATKPVMVTPTQPPAQLPPQVDNPYLALSQTANEVLAAERELSLIRAQSERKSMLTGFILGLMVGLVLTSIGIGSQDMGQRAELNRQIGNLQQAVDRVDRDRERVQRDLDLVLDYVRQVSSVLVDLSRRGQQIPPFPRPPAEVKELVDQTGLSRVTTPVPFVIGPTPPTPPTPSTPPSTGVHPTLGPIGPPAPSPIASAQPSTAPVRAIVESPKAPVAAPSSAPPVTVPRASPSARPVASARPSPRPSPSPAPLNVAAVFEAAARSLEAARPKEALREIRPLVAKADTLDTRSTRDRLRRFLIDLGERSWRMAVEVDPHDQPLHVGTLEVATEALQEALLLADGPSPALQLAVQELTTGEAVSVWDSAAGPRPRDPPPELKLTQTSTGQVFRGRRITRLPPDDYEAVPKSPDADIEQITRGMVSTFYFGKNKECREVRLTVKRPVEGLGK